MRRTFSFFALTIALQLVCSAAEPAEPTETVVRMTVQPMTAPKPALKYQLLPELWEMNPGNPVFEYLRCFAGEQNVFYRQDAFDEREKWLGMPLKDLPVETVLSHIRGVPRNVDWAARFDTPDWQFLLRFKRDGARTILNEVPQTRNLALVRKLQFRVDVAKHDFAEAIVGAKTLFAMSRHLGEHATMVGTSCGILVAHLGLDPLEEMIEQPGCPNLFWALANLPNPLVNMENGLASERATLAYEFVPIDETSPMTNYQLKVVDEQLIEMVGWSQEGEKKRKVFQDRLNASVNNEVGVAAARKRLIELGSNRAKIEQFPPTQVILLDEWHKHEVLRDDVLKLMHLPYWQVEAALIESAEKAASEKESLLAPFTEHLLVIPVCQAGLQQRIALLQCVEALRLYAADYDSKLPAKLDDVPVPLPIDPVTGKPFAYKLEGATAILHGTPPRGKEKDPQYNRRYEITIRK